MIDMGIMMHHHCDYKPLGMPQRMCSLAQKCVLLLKNVFSCSRMCSLHTHAHARARARTHTHTHTHTVHDCLGIHVNAVTLPGANQSDTYTWPLSEGADTFWQAHILKSSFSRLLKSQCPGVFLIHTPIERTFENVLRMMASQRECRFILVGTHSVNVFL
jgi:hypothetical protein